jgi:UMF1 family MFS transporter
MHDAAGDDDRGAAGTGKAFGYAGSLAVLLIIKPIVVEQGFQAAFFPSGALFMLFALPCLIFVKEKPAEIETDRIGLTETMCSLRESLRELIKRPGIKDFLKAVFWAVAPLNAVILFMSLYLTRVYGMSESRIMQFLMFAGAFAVAGSFGLGHLSDRIGYKCGLYLVLIALATGFFAAAFASGQAWYPWIAAVFGIGFGGIWTVARAIGARVVPSAQIGELFGLFALVAYIGAMAGPLLWGMLVLLMTPLGILRYRITVAVLGLLPLVSLKYLKRFTLDSL